MTTTSGTATNLEKLIFVIPLVLRIYMVETSISTPPQNSEPAVRGTLRDALQRAAGHAAYHITSWVLSHPMPLRLLFGVLRRIRPVAILGSTVIVAKGAYVRDVLERFDDFTLGEVLTPRMPWGPFLLTIDWRDQHDRERALFKSMVVPAADVARIAATADRVCAAAVAVAPVNLASRREIDVVQHLCEPVVVALAAEYFGIPVIERNAPRMARVLRQVAGIAMVAPPAGSRRARDADKAIADLTALVEAAIRDEARHAQPAPLAPADPRASLLVRLVRAARATDKPAWLDDDFVRRYVTGLAATGGATIVRAASNGIGELLKRPDALRRARAAVDNLELAMREEVRLRRDPMAASAQHEEAAQRVADGRRAFLAIVYEAMRFRPMLPLLLRYAPRDTLIAKGTRHERRIKAGSSVVAGPLAVMFDPDDFESPGRFLTTRPIERFVHFGFGPRTCFGRYVADTALLEIFRAVVKLPDVALGSGGSGRVAFDGPVADSLTITFAPFTRHESADM